MQQHTGAVQMLHLGLKPTSVLCLAFRSDTLPAELFLPPCWAGQETLLQEKSIWFIAEPGRKLWCRTCILWMTAWLLLRSGWSAVGCTAVVGSVFGVTVISVLYWCHCDQLYWSHCGQYYTGVTVVSVLYWCHSDLCVILVLLWPMCSLGVTVISVFYWCHCHQCVLLVSLWSGCYTGVTVISVLYWCHCGQCVILVSLWSVCYTGVTVISVLHWCHCDQSVILNSSNKWELTSF